MDQILINPNVAYVLLILGFLTAVLALFAPGTGILEFGALVALALAGYAIANLPVHWWAFAILIAALLPFLLSLRRTEPRRRVALITGAALLVVVGSALLFQGEGLRPAVHPLLLVLLSPIAVGLSYWIASKSLEAIQARPVFDLDRLVGMIGQASSDIRGAGSVYVNGEEWSATSTIFIPAGKPVRVLRRSGLTLEVEPAGSFEKRISMEEPNAR